MRIAFISTMFGHAWGGSEELWSRAAAQLHREGHEVSASVVRRPRFSPKILELKKQGIDIAMHDRRPSLPAKAWREIAKRLGIAQPEISWLRHKKPDLVVISQGGNYDGLKWMTLCRELKLSFATIAQCNSEIWWPGDDISGELAAAYRAATKIFCVSQHNLKLLKCQIGESLPNADIVWNPFNVPADQPPAWPKENGVLKLACVARLEPAAKGQDLLFQVLSQPEWRKRPVEVNLYGTGPCEDNLRRLIEWSELKNVHIRGHVQSVAAIWEQNHLLMLPSRYEGLPLALVEAMWCGRPAVVSDVGGNAELCVDGETGFVADAPVMAILGQTMERAWNRRHEWESMGKAGRARLERILPKDPIGDFCIQLTNCAPKESAASVN